MSALPYMGGGWQQPATGLFRGSWTPCAACPCPPCPGDIGPALPQPVDPKYGPGPVMKPFEPVAPKPTPVDPKYGPGPHMQPFQPTHTNPFSPIHGRYGPPGPHLTPLQPINTPFQPITTQPFQPINTPFQPITTQPFQPIKKPMPTRN